MLSGVRLRFLRRFSLFREAEAQASMLREEVSSLRLSDSDVNADLSALANARETEKRYQATLMNLRDANATIQEQQVRMAKVRREMVRVLCNPDSFLVKCIERYVEERAAAMGEKSPRKPRAKRSV